MTLLKVEEIFTISSLAFAGAFLAALFIQRKKHRSYYLLMLGILIGQARQLCTYFITAQNHHLQFIFNHYTLVTLSFIIIPLPYLYIRSFTDPLFKLRQRFYPHLIMVLFCIGTFYLFDSLNIFGDPQHIRRKIYLGVFIAALVSLPYLVASQKVVNQFETFLKQNYSDITRLRVNWLKLLLAVLYVAVAFQFLDVVTGPNIPLWQLAPIFTTLTIFSLTLFSLIHSRIIEDVNQDQKVLTKERTTQEVHLSEIEIERYKKKLFEYLDEEKPYLNTQLDLKELSHGIGLKPYKTSELINTVLGTNFYNLINSRRVAHAKQLLVDPKSAHLNILGIAGNSGFNSKSVFNDVFKKIALVTPKQYRAAKMSENLKQDVLIP